MEAEIALLGLALMEPDLSDSWGLTPEHFYDLRCREAWLALSSLRSRNQEVNTVTVWESIDPTHRNAVGGLSFLSQAVESAAPADMAPSYVQVVKDYRERREFSHALATIAGNCMTDGVDATLEKLAALSPERVSVDLATASSLIADVAKKIVDVADGVRVDDSVIPTGIKALDAMVGGVRRGVLTIVAGRPSMGKSSLARTIALRSAIKGLKVHVESLEDTAQSWATRTLSELSGIDLAQLSRNEVPSHARRLLSECHKVLDGAKLTVSDSSSVSTANLSAIVARLKPDLVVVDYLQLLHGVGQDRFDQVNQVVRTLAMVARRHNAAVIAVSQLSRNCESREDKRPMLSDLRESGEIEQAADMVVFCYREHYYRKNSDPAKAELIVSKNKNGPTGAVGVGWRASLASFYDL